MRLGGAFRRTIAVESQTDDRAPALPLALDTVAGARWGQPARFDVGSTPQPPGPRSLTFGWLHEIRLFLGVESHREFAGVAVVPDVAAEAVRSVTFYLGEREVERERREMLGGGGATSVTPLIEVIREYARLDFPFEAEAARGEPHPPETPPREEPDYG